jgi:hypothetical protein
MSGGLLPGFPAGLFLQGVEGKNRILSVTLQRYEFICNDTKKLFMKYASGSGFFLAREAIQGDKAGVKNKFTTRKRPWW